MRNTHRETGGERHLVQPQIWGSKNKYSKMQNVSCLQLTCDACSLPSVPTWKGVLIRLTSVSKMCTLSCWWRRMKERKVWSRAGSVTLLRKRSRYAVVVITSSRVSFTERREDRVGGHNVELVLVQLQRSIYILAYVY